MLPDQLIIHTMSKTLLITLEIIKRLALVSLPVSRTFRIDEKPI